MMTSEHSFSETGNETSPHIDGNGDVASPPAKELPSPSAPNDKIADLTHRNDSLVREVTSLRSAKADLAEKVEEMEKKLQDNCHNAETLQNEKDQIQERRDEILHKVSDLKNEVSAMKAYQSALENGIFSLNSEKELLETALSKSRTDVTETARLLEEATSDETNAKSKVVTLKNELSKLSGDEQRLTAEIEALMADNKEKDSLIDSLKVQKADLEKERTRLVSEILKGDDESSKVKQKIEKLSGEEMRLKEENTGLEKALSTASQQAGDLEIRNRALSSRIEGLEADISNLQKKLETEVSDHENASQYLAKAQEHNTALKEELFTVHLEKYLIQLYLDSVLASFQKFQEIASKEQSQLSMLEDQVSALLKEKLPLEDSKIALEVEVEKLTVKSTDVLNNAQAELCAWKMKAETLEGALKEISDESTINEKKVRQLLSDLQSLKDVLKQKSTINKFAISAAAASAGTLALIGVVAYLRCRKQP